MKWVDAFLVGERRAVFGTVAMAAVNIIKLCLQFAVLPILARILGPSSFGLIAVAMPFILLANMMSDLGLGNALVRKPDSSRELESTVFWLSLLISGALALVVCLLAWPMSHVLSAPKLTPIMMTLSMVLPLGGSLSVANARIARERRFSLFAAGEIMAGVASSAAAIGVALAGLGPWSLVVQQFVLWCVKASWLIPASGFRPSFFCKVSLALPYLGFGLNAAAANLADFATKNLPMVIVGGLIGVTAAGYYSMAYQIVRMPELVISGPIYLSIFAAVAQRSHEGSEATALVLRGLRGLATVLAPLFCGLALIAHVAVTLLLGPKWSPTGTILALLAPAGFFLCLYSFVTAVLMGLGQSPQQLRLTLMCGGFIVAGTLVGAHYGAQGVALGISTGTVLAAPVYLRVLSKQIAISPRTVAGVMASPILATTIMAIAVALLLRQIGGWSPWVQLAALIACGVFSFSIVLAAISWRRLEEDLNWLLENGHASRAELS